MDGYIILFPTTGSGFLVREPSHRGTVYPDLLRPSPVADSISSLDLDRFVRPSHLNCPAQLNQAVPCHAMPCHAPTVVLVGAERLMRAESHT